MKAAVVNDFQHPPSYQDFAPPIPQAGETIVHVTAAALSPLVKGQAAGKHYSSEAKFPFIPGVDGVGKLADGTSVYFAFPTRPYGAMAETTVVASEHCIPLPAGVSHIMAAAMANPGMSSWAALTLRARFERGEAVLINGATGSAGRLAIQIARYLGASRIVVTGRNRDSLAGLASLGADVLVPLDQAPETLIGKFRQEIAANHVAVILDYLYGPSAEALLAAAVGKGGPDAEPRIRFVQIGSVSGSTITLPAAALRSSGLELMGSGLGSVSNTSLLAAIADLLAAIIPGQFTVDADPVPLANVNTAWESASASRIVFTI
jgi:NADPH:quinone reductase-like Zn-dependent oxidoreductase